MNRLVDIATRSAWARPICLGTSSPKMIVKIVRRPVTTMRAIAPGDRPGAAPNAASQSRMPSTRLTAANADARKPRKLIPIWMTARNRPGFSLRRWTRRAPPVALVDELLEPAPTDRDQGDLGRREDPVEQDEDDDDGELEDRRRSSGGSSRAAGLRRGSRIRAGTPTASLPAGTSRVTTAPAPVRAPSPTSTGATSIVSTPMNAPSPIVVGCLRVPS